MVVRKDGASNMTAGGIYIPDSVAERPNRGEVVIGPRSSGATLHQLKFKAATSIFEGDMRIDGSDRQL